MSDQRFQDLIQKINTSAEELKEIKSRIKELESDVPMELEDLMISLKDLKKQAKDRKDEFIRDLLNDNAEYPELRERVQMIKEEAANAKLELFTLAQNQSREKGDIDKTVNVQGMPMRLQTQKEVQVYLNGKVVK